MKRWMVLFLLNGLIYSMLILSVIQIGHFPQKPFTVLSEWVGAFLIIAAAGSLLRWFNPREKQLFWIMFLIMFTVIGIVLFFLF
ncbi:hypothetical protein [Metabacillus sp. FJAT-52054]|uniref:DUF3953 domain-containing protein n=1 Tax=Metabacillus sediminis TaxID=3117746 RepID=A0ABZ2NL70_9BACI